MPSLTGLDGVGAVAYPGLTPGATSMPPSGLSDLLESVLDAADASDPVDPIGRPPFDPQAQQLVSRKDGRA
jgi:hypothetical protein